MNPKPFLDAIPSITSPYSLICFTLVIMACVFAYSIKAEGPFFRVIEKKFTKAQAYGYLKLLTILCFAFSIVVFILGYTIELVKLLIEKTNQTSIILFDNKYDISNSPTEKFEPKKGSYISTNPVFAFPALNSANWESPKWITTKEDLEKFMKMVMPKDIKFEGPFFDFLKNGKALFIFGKDSISLTLDRETNIIQNYPFEENPLNGIFEDPFSIIGHSHIGVLIVPKNSLSNKFKTVSTTDILHFFIGSLPLNIEQVLSTPRSAAFTSRVKFTKALFQNERQDLTIFKCTRVLENKSNLYILEGACYAPEISPIIASDMTSCIFRFQIPNE